MWLSGKLAHTRVMLGRVMADDFGEPDRSATLGVIERLARAEARMPCLYKVEARMAAAARARGYAVLPVAREAVLDPASFHLVGPARARLRRKLAHARKAGVAVEDCVTPPLAEMAAVAAQWQVAHGRERGFSMGRWERTYAAGQRVITARTADGRLMAFVTFHAGQRNWVLDLVRVMPDAPDGTIYAMILHAIEMARWHQIAELSLAAVPEPAFGLTGVLGRIARHATRGSVGLAQFKSAFAPHWRVLYIAAPSRLALLIGGLEVGRAVMRPAPLAKGRQALVVLDGVAAVAGEPVQTERAA
jgi:phosphatidylglycerol lysyltransferase